MRAAGVCGATVLALAVSTSACFSPDYAEGALIPGWDSDSPFPILAVTCGGSGNGWFLSFGTVLEDGGVFVSGAPLQLRVWGWPSGGPTLVYDGGGTGTLLPGWSSAEPSALVVMTGLDGGAGWSIRTAEPRDDGVLEIPAPADKARVWMWWR